MGNHVSLARNVLLFISISRPYCWPLCETYRFLFYMKRKQSVALGKKCLTSPLSVSTAHQDEWSWWAVLTDNGEVIEPRIMVSESFRFLSHNLSPWLAYSLITTHTHTHTCVRVFAYICIFYIVRACVRATWGRVNGRSDVRFAAARS